MVKLGEIRNICTKVYEYTKIDTKYCCFLAERNTYKSVVKHAVHIAAY